MAIVEGRHLGRSEGGTRFACRKDSIRMRRGFDTCGKRMRCGFQWGTGCGRQMDERDPESATWRFQIVLDSSENEPGFALNGPRNHVALDLRTVGRARVDAGALCPCRRDGIREGATWTTQGRRKDSILDGREKTPNTKEKGKGPAGQGGAIPLMGGQRSQYHASRWAGRAPHPSAEAESVVDRRPMLTESLLGYVPMWVGPSRAGNLGMEVRFSNSPFDSCKLLPLKTQSRKVGALSCLTGSG